MLAALQKAHPRAISASDLAAASGAAEKTAREVRAALRLAGLIEETTVWGRGGVSELAISLTPLGTEIGRLALKMEAIFKAHDGRQEAASRKKPV